MIRIIISIMAMSVMFSAAVGKEAESTITDPVLEKRMAALTSELRCLVCQGESLADSHSDFAKDMRSKILTLMQQGKSDKEITDFLVQRYGDFILFRPPLNSTTVLLWFGPLMFLIVGAGVLLFNLVRRRRRAHAAPLSPEELARVNALLSEQSGDSKA